MSDDLRGLVERHDYQLSQHEKRFDRTDQVIEKLGDGINNLATELRKDREAQQKTIHKLILWLYGGAGILIGLVFKGDELLRKLLGVFL